MKWALKIWFIIMPLTFPTLLEAWGYDGHRRINYIASKQLKGPFGQFLKNNSDPLKWYAVAPDYNKDIDREEFHRHFIDTDYYDEYPFTKIPKKYPFSRFDQTAGSAISLGANRAIAARALQGRKNIGKGGITANEQKVLDAIKAEDDGKTYPIWGLPHRHGNAKRIETMYKFIILNYSIFKY